jgi:hypothetical protein
MKQIFRHKEREGHEVREDNHRGLSLQSEKSRPELFVRFALLLESFRGLRKFSGMPKRWRGRV